MNEVTKILRAAESGEAPENVTEKLLPLVYDELRRLAAHQMAGWRSDQTLQATALVYEAYLGSWAGTNRAVSTGMAAAIFLRRRPRPCAGS
jgi:hypothetical protein